MLVMLSKKRSLYSLIGPFDIDKNVIFLTERY